MLVCDYIVEQIDGDYAHLRRVDLPDEELKLVARALLPAEIVEGCKLHYELMQYTILQKTVKTKTPVQRLLITAHTMCGQLRTISKWEFSFPLYSL